MKTLTQLKQLFSSISLKLFFWFWLTILVSVLVTRFISSQLEQDIKLLPPQKHQLMLTKRIAKEIKKSSQPDLAKTVKRLRHKYQRVILLKDMQNQKVLFINNRKYPNIERYLSANQLTTKKTLSFPRLNITGPVVTYFNDKKYQVFLVDMRRKYSFGAFVLRLPPWARIAIPIFISLILSILLAKTLTRPILAIQNAAKKLGDGKLTTRLATESERNDELGQLAKSFNQMAEKLECNVTAHQRLLADVSHELRSPLARLQIAINLLQQSANKPMSSPEEQDRHLNRCEIEISRLDNMIGDILALSRLEHGNPTYDFTPHRIEEILQQVTLDSQYLAQEKSINILVDLDKPKTYININEKQLISAINNIVINAIKYSPNDSNITLSTLIKQKTLVISVSDQGLGVPESSLEQLFQPFFRVNVARDRETGGTGLGLAIAKQAVQIHHGTIIAKNNNDKGLTVEITLPLSSAS